jgi:hypothetical protein
MKVCPRCNAVYDGHKWVPEPDEELLKLMKSKNPRTELCPGDLRLERRQVEGVVTLKGGFMSNHRDEIKNLVSRVERKGRSRNVAARIFEMTEQNGELSIETTDDHLAERIGKEVEKAFKGDLEIKWQEKDRFARVVWQREK